MCFGILDEQKNTFAHSALGPKMSVLGRLAYYVYNEHSHDTILVPFMKFFIRKMKNERIKGFLENIFKQIRFLSLL